MKRLLLPLLLVLLIVPMVSASTRTMNTNIDIDETLVNGNQQLGEILVSQNTIVGERFNVSTFSVITAETNDIGTWIGNGTLLIKKSGIFVGFWEPYEDFVFSVPGIYNYTTSGGNVTSSGQIVITDPEILLINIEIKGTPFAYHIEPNPFTLSGSGEVVEISVDVDEDTIVKDYPYELVISSQFENVTLSRNFSIQEYENWNLTENTVNKTYSIKSGTVEPLGYFKIVNTGNVDFPVTIELLGDGKSFIQTQSQQTLYRKTFTLFNIIGQIPSRTEHGVYNVTAIIKGGDIQKTYEFSLTVTDVQGPEIKRISFQDVTVYHTNEMVVEATDNIGVRNVTVKYDDETHTMIKDQQLYTWEYPAKIPGIKTFTICAEDVSGNKECVDYNETFTKLDIIAFSPNINMVTKKTGLYASAVLFNISEKPPESIEVKLVDFTTNYIEEGNYSQGANSKLRIVDGEGSVIQLNNIGDVIQVYNQGQIKVEITSDRDITYDVVLQIIPRSYMENITTLIRISGRFRDYNVPEPFTIGDWYGNKPFSCTVTDTGDVENSFYDCKVQFPITVDVKDLAIPTLPQEKTATDTNFQNILKQEREKIKKKNLYISAILGILGITIGWLIYGAKVYPYFRFKGSGGK